MKLPDRATDIKVGGKTPDEIKRGLESRTCHDDDMFVDCSHCPYYLTCTHCDIEMHKNALAYIQQLETRLAQAERERDAAVGDLSDSCKFCNFAKQGLEKLPCDKCFQRVGKHPWSPMVRTRFEWRGVCDENTKEE